jgi:hypothetical protein
MREKADFGCDEPIGALVLVIEPVGSRFSNFVTGGPQGELRRSQMSVWLAWPDPKGGALLRIAPVNSVKPARSPGQAR